MTPNERKCFTKQAGQIFNIMDNHSSVIVCDIKQLYNDFVVHDLRFSKHGRENVIYHRVYLRGDFSRHELYKFYPNSIRKFIADIYIFSPVEWKLFDRWSKMDINGMLKKINLKIVEMI